MILVDIGNSGLHFALGRRKNLSGVCYLKRENFSKKAVNNILSKYPKEDILICSVVPQVTKTFKKLKTLQGRKIHIAGEDIKIPLKCFYNKKKVGKDRLVGALAAGALYPHTRLIIDFGTAITFDFLSKKGDYLGGFILPGVGSTLKVFSTCALLPKKIRLKKTKRLIPKNTEESISKGVVLGFSSMINSLVAKYKKLLKLKNKDPLLVTGGDAPPIASCLDSNLIYEPHLVLKGLLILSKKLPSRSPSRNILDVKQL